MSKLSFPERAIYVCTGSKCRKKGGKSTCKALKHLIKENGLRRQVEVIKTGCTGRCKYAPVLSIQPANTWLITYDENHPEKLLKAAFDADA